MKRLIICLMLLSGVAFSATTITDTITDSDGSLTNGTVIITPSARFVTSDGRFIFSAPVSVPVVNGAFSVSLESNTGTVPATTYTVIYKLTSAIKTLQKTEQWLVPVSATPLKISQVVQTVVAASTGIVVPTRTSQLTNDSGFITNAVAAPVQSVAGHTGTIVLNHSDISDWTAATAGFGGTYTLPVATSTVLGGVKQGSNTAIAGDGTITVPVGAFDAINAASAAQAAAIAASDPLGSAATAKTQAIAASDPAGTAASQITALGLKSASTHLATDFEVPLTFSAGVTRSANNISLTTPVPTLLSQLTNDPGFVTATTAPVRSVATRAGAITLTHSDLTDWAAATSGFQSALGFTPENSANKGAVSGYAPLDASSLVPLLNLPTIPSTKTSGFASVATSGSYPDLINKPTIPAAAAWGGIGGTLANQTDLSTALSGKQASLGFTPENSANKGAASGYAPLDPGSKVPLANVPTIPNTQTSGFATVATSGSYTDLTNKPTIPTVTFSGNTTKAASTTGTLVNGHCATWDVNGNVVDSGAPCGTSSMVYPAAGVAVSSGSAWLASLTAPASALVGISDAQTITNKSIASSEITGLPAFPAGAILGTTDTQTLINKSIDAGQLTGSIVAARMPGFTGDISTSAGGTATTLATVNVAPGACGDATHVCQVTTTGKGLTTSQSAVAITVPTASTGLTNTSGAFSVSYGTAVGTSTQGNDARVVNAVQDPGANGLTARVSANTVAARTLQPTSGNALTWTNPDGVSGNPTPAFVFPAKLYFRSVCQGTTAYSPFDLPASAAPTPNCVTGTNTNFGVTTFTATGQTAQGHFKLTSDWTGAIDVEYVYRSAGTTGNVVWNIATACVADGSTDDPTFNTAQTVSTAAQSTTLWQKTASIAGITTTGCGVNKEFFFKIGLDSTTTTTGNEDLIGLRLTTRRAL